MKINQKQFAYLFGSFNIIVSFNNKSIRELEQNKVLSDNLVIARDTEIKRFKTLFNELTTEQKQAVDMVEFALAGFEFESYSDFVDNNPTTE